MNSVKNKFFTRRFVPAAQSLQAERKTWLLKYLLKGLLRYGAALLFAYGLNIVIVKNKEYHRFLNDMVKVHKNRLLKCGFNGIVIVKNRNILELSILF